jgi:Zn-dependent metalloprotease
MKYSTLLLSVFMFLFSTLLLHSQNTGKAAPGLSEIAWTKPASNHLTFKPRAQIPAAEVFTQYYKAFGLNENDEMQLIRTDEDKTGMRHYRYQQNHKGFPVDGAVFLIHEKDGKAKTGNGTIVKGLNISYQAAVTPEVALQSAMAAVPSQKYAWQDNDMELLLKELKNDPAATHYPALQLVIFDKKFSGKPENYRLAYKTEIYSLQPLARKYVYIDAFSGEVIHTINMIQNTDVPANGVTKYNGSQQIMVDSISPGSYRLRETGRGNGIITRSTQNSENYAMAVDIYDDNTTLFNSDDVAISAHWASEMTYDYYFNTFGRNSFDNNGAILMSYVHFGNNYANAFWDGSKMTYGDGNSQYSAFTTIDICGHEITHAVTTYTADLIYQDESGALNEAFSDIFGTCVEFYADNTPNWLMGEDIGNPIRSLSNPNQYQNPDTYHGTYWDNDPYGMDNGGVHTNCGVGSFWFYLLSEGGTGTNDNGELFSVNPLGRNIAEQIAYHTLAYYLTPASDYYDAYLASIAAAENLYGTCSAEVLETAAAWAAVGVGFPFDPQEVYVLDIVSPATACDLHSETVSIRIFYNGCDTMLQALDTISVAYRFDGGAIEQQDYILQNDWNGGDSLIVDFTVPVDASTLGNHTLNCWVKYGSGTGNYNDSIMNYTFTTLLQQNINVGMKSITAPVSECHLSPAEQVTVKFAFFGCDFLPAGTSVDLKYRVNSGTIVTEPCLLTSDLNPGEELSYTFIQTFDGTADGTYTIDAWTAFSPDTMTANDAFLNYKIKNIGSLDTDTLGFEETNALDYVLIKTKPHSNVYIKNQAHAPGSTKGLLMTGGNAMTYIDMLELPTGFNTWQINEFLSAKAIFCVDATTWNTCYLKFDLKQTHGGTLYSQYIGGAPEDYRVASNLRILANISQIGGTYNPTTPGSDPFVTHLINLNAYAGNDFNLTFETRNIAKDTTILLPVILDNAYLDNVHFFPGPDAADDTAGVNNQWPAAIAVLNNDNHHNVAQLITTIITQPQHGTASVNTDQTISYTPDDGFTGNDTLQYKCCYITDTIICDQAYLALRVYSDMSAENTSGFFSLNIYPNPFSETFNIEAGCREQTTAIITINDVLGRNIITSELYLNAGRNIIVSDLSDQPQGMYFIGIKTSSDYIVLKANKK